MGDYLIKVKLDYSDFILMEGTTVKGLRYCYYYKIMDNWVIPVVDGNNYGYTSIVNAKKALSYFISTGMAYEKVNAYLNNEGKERYWISVSSFKIGDTILYYDKLYTTKQGVVTSKQLDYYGDGDFDLISIINNNERFISEEIIIGHTRIILTEKMKKPTKRIVVELNSKEDLDKFLNNEI